MAMLMSTYIAENNKGKACVYVADSAKFGSAFIKYFDANGSCYFTEDFPDMRLEEVEMIAEDWALGHHSLEATMESKHAAL